MVNVIHDIESKVSQWIDDSGERKSLLKEEELKELAEDVKLCNDAFYEFMRTNRLIIEMANHALLSEDAHEFTSIKQVGQFMQKKFGKDSQVYKEFEEDFSEDPSYKEIWSMLIEISNHPEIKKLKLEINLKNAVNVSYILGSLLPLTPIEKQTMLELEGSTEKLDYLKSIIKRLGG